MKDKGSWKKQGFDSRDVEGLRDLNVLIALTEVTWKKAGCGGYMKVILNDWGITPFLVYLK